MDTYKEIRRDFAACYRADDLLAGGIDFAVPIFDGVEIKALAEDELDFELLARVSN